MSVLRVAAAAALVAGVSAGSGSYNFTGAASIDFSWTTDAENITMSFACVPKTSEGNTSWCAVAINTAGNAAMAPGECFWISVDKAGAVRAEDRNLVAAVEPSCMGEQLSHLVSASTPNVPGVGTVIMATITRPLNVTGAQKKHGYVSIENKDVSLIAAIGAGTRVTHNSCKAGGSEEHYEHFSGTANLLA